MNQLCSGKYLQSVQVRTLFGYHSFARSSSYTESCIDILNALSRMRFIWLFHFQIVRHPSNLNISEFGCCESFCSNFHENAILAKQSVPNWSFCRKNVYCAQMPGGFSHFLLETTIPTVLRWLAWLKLSKGNILSFLIVKPLVAFCLNSKTAVLFIEACLFLKLRYQFFN